MEHMLYVFNLQRNDAVKAYLWGDYPELRTYFCSFIPNIASLKRWKKFTMNKCILHHIDSLINIYIHYII